MGKHLTKVFNAKLLAVWREGFGNTIGIEKQAVVRLELNLQVFFGSIFHHTERQPAFWQHFTLARRGAHHQRKVVPALQRVRRPDSGSRMA